MLESLAGWLTRGMIRTGSVPPEDEDIYVYGWSLILAEAGNVLTMLLIGLLSGEFIGTLIFLFTFIILRIYAGGFHADSFGACYIFSVLLYAAALLLYKFIPVAWESLALVVMLALSALITYIWSPVDHPNKPQNAAQKAKNKKISSLIITLEIICVLLIWLWQPNSMPYLLWAALGSLTTSLTLFYLIIRPYGSANASINS